MMSYTPLSGYNQAQPTHHLVLSDEASPTTTRLGLILLNAGGKDDPKAITEMSNPRTALRVASGAGGYTDYEGSTTPIPMIDWSGGGGQEKFESDTTRYYSGQNVDTSYGKILPAGKRQSSSGYERVLQAVGTKDATIDENYGGWGGPPGTWVYIASKFKASGNHDVRSITINIKTSEGGFRGVRAYLYSDSAGLPNTQLAMGEGVGAAGAHTSTTQIRIPITYTLVSGTTYHVVFAFNFLTGFDIELERDSSEADTAIIRMTGYSPSYTWAVYAATQSIVYKLEGSAVGKVQLLEIKGVVHAINQASDASAPKLWRLGICGKCTSNASDKSKTNTGVTLAGGVDLTGKTIRILAGPGVNESQSWRTITGNTTGANAVISVSPPWNTTHSTATTFVVPDYDVWTECTISTFPPTKPITDWELLDDKLYLCQGTNADIGTAANVCSVVMTFGSSGPTYAGTDEGAQRDRIVYYVDKSGGAEWLLTTQDSILTIYKSARGSLISTGGTGKAIGTNARRITGLAVFGDPMMPHVFMDNEFGSVSSFIYYPIQLREMQNLRSEYMGRATISANRFLYFTLGEGLERYTSGIVDDVGPDRGEGLPSTQRGPIVALVAYGGGALFAAIDAGDSGYSSILKYNEAGWCSVYVSTTLGNSIKALFIQSVSGKPYQRLWFAEEEELYWMPIAKAPLHTTGFQFALTCELITSWIYTNYKDIQKLWYSLKLFMINASAARNVVVDYRKDGDTAWTNFATYTGSGGASEKQLLNSSATNASADVAGTRLQFRFTLTTNDATTPVYVDTALAEVVTRVPGRKSWVVTARVMDFGFDLTGDREPLSAYAIKAILETWANSSLYGKRVYVRSLIESFDSKLAFVDFGSFRPIAFETDPSDSRRSTLVCQFTLSEA